MKKFIILSVLSGLMVSCFNYIPTNAATIDSNISNVVVENGIYWGTINKTTNFYNMYSKKLTKILNPGDQVMMATDGQGNYKKYYMKNSIFYQVSYNNEPGYVDIMDVN